MKLDTSNKINTLIGEATRQAADTDNLSAPVLERFLRTGEETWEGAGSGQFIVSYVLYSRNAKAAVRILFDLLATLLPREIQLAPPVPPDVVRQRVEPMVRGLVQKEWQDVALRELSKRTFILNFQGAKAAIEAEFSTSYLRAAWQVLWACFSDFGIVPDGIRVDLDGISAGAFGHVTWSAYNSNDPYIDVIVHEGAHLLHYLKPAQYGFHVRRGQERFVDVEFKYREIFAYSCEAYTRVLMKGTRKSRTAFAATMRSEAFSFPPDNIDEVAALVASAASARNGWRIIREATVIRPTRRRSILTD